VDNPGNSALACKFVPIIENNNREQVLQAVMRIIIALLEPPSPERAAESAAGVENAGDATLA